MPGRSTLGALGEPSGSADGQLAAGAFKLSRTWQLARAWACLVRSGTTPYPKWGWPRRRQTITCVGAGPG